MSAAETIRNITAKRTVKDAQTGKDFDIIPEGRIDVAFAWISAAYSLAVIGFLVWLVLDMLHGQAATTAPDAAATAAVPTGSASQVRGTLTAWLMPLLSTPTSKLIFYTAIGGAIGAAVNNLRSFITWHAEEKAFGWRFIWKYLAMPPLGGTLAVLVYGILQGGMTVFTGGSSPNGNQVTSLSAWATGTLAGYGAHKVFKWLDVRVNSLFKVDSKTVAVPDLKGKSLEEAKLLVADAQLEVGTISEVPASSDQVGKVIAQTPEAGTEIDCGSKVDLIVGKAGPVDPSNPGPTDVTAKPQEEGTIPQNGQPVTGSETTLAETPEGQTVGTETGEIPTSETVTDDAEANASENVKEEA